MKAQDDFRVLGPEGESINITAPMYMYNHKMTVEPSTVGEAIADYTFSFIINREIAQENEDYEYKLCASVNFTDYFKHANLSMER